VRGFARNLLLGLLQLDDLATLVGITLHNLLVEHREQMWLVCNPEQIIYSLGIAAQMRFLPSAKRHDLIESD
jgi:hypothetical protein